jgi:hypothetical protein
LLEFNAFTVMVKLVPTVALLGAVIVKWVTVFVDVVPPTSVGTSRLATGVPRPVARS